MPCQYQFLVSRHAQHEDWNQKKPPHSSNDSFVSWILCIFWGRTIKSNHHISHVQLFHTILITKQQHPSKKKTFSNNENNNRTSLQHLTCSRNVLLTGGIWTFFLVFPPRGLYPIATKFSILPAWI